MIIGFKEIRNVFLLCFMALILVSCGKTSITISFDSNGGTVVLPIETNEKSTISMPDDPTKEGYSFIGWYLDNHTFKQSFNSDTIFYLSLTSDFTVYAKWIKEEEPKNEVKVTFDARGGTTPEDQCIEKGNTIAIPLSEKEGYTLDGWYTSLDNGITLEDKWIFTIYVVSQDISLYAKWKINQYTMSFESNGGSSINPITQNYKTEIFKPIPIQEGHFFVGWFEDIELNTEYNFTTMPAQNKTLYAKWGKNKYSINYYDVLFDNTLNLPLYPGETIIQVSLGECYSSALTSSGRIFTWGGNSYGQLGDGTTEDKFTPTDITRYFNLEAEDKIIQVSLGDQHSSALTSSGRIFTWGSNSYGQLGDGTTEAKFTPTDITSYFNLEADDKIIQVSLGSNHTSAITLKGHIFTWGVNWYGQLGDGTREERYCPTDITSRFNLEVNDRIIQISLGNYHSFALTLMGNIFTWGVNWHGQLGTGTKEASLTPTDITSSLDLEEKDKVVQVVSGYENSSVLTLTGRIFTWGFNWYGQLGDGTTEERHSPTDITSRFNLEVNDRIIQVSLGGSHSSVNTLNGNIFTWGSNHYGQLGDGTTINRHYQFDITSCFNLETEETLIQVSSGSFHSLALTSNGRIFAWGNNDYGQLGDETKIIRFSPVEITSYFNLQENETIIQVISGFENSSALTSSGRIFTWGNNDDGQLGDGTTEERYCPTDITSHFDLEESDKIIHVSLGYSHSSALTSSGRIFTWGYNDDGQLGDGTTEERYCPTDITSHFDLEESDKIIHVSLGSYHSSALTFLGRILAWGNNFSGQLGDGTTEERYSPTDITSHFDLEESDKIIYTSLGSFHSSALTFLGRILAWGNNFYGQLADGTKPFIDLPLELSLYGKEIISQETYDFKELLEYIPTKEGYTFNGWYCDIYLTIPFTLTNMPSKDIDLYACWIKNN